MDRGGHTMSTITHKNVFRTLEKWAPKSLAYDWDNVGLQVGNVHDETKKVLITLDVTNDVVNEAIRHDVNLIIAHHPLLFQSIKQIDFSTPKGKVIQKLIQHNITVYAAHTNLDIAEGGVNDLLLDALDISNRKNFIPFKEEALYKLVIFVPNTHETELRDALSDAGAGHIGNYSHCTFRQEGQGTFKPLDGTNPYIGSQNELTFVDEIKLETIVTENNMQQVLQAMFQAHPYEEVAYDLYPLQQKGHTFGLGRIGTLDTPQSLMHFVERVKDAYGLEKVKVVGDVHAMIQKVAVLGGSGEKYIAAAKKMGADVYITGDLTFHHAQDGMEMGIHLIDAGHYIEQIMKQATKTYIEAKYPTLSVMESTINTNPFQFL